MSDIPFILDQTFEMRDLSTVTLHPRNPNKGDIDEIEKSIKTNGFWGTIVVQKSTGHVLIGNHRVAVARESGMPQLPAMIVDVDDVMALRILAGDNRLTRLGVDDDEILAEILVELAMAPQGLEGTGYDEADLDAILAAAEKDQDDLPAEPKSKKKPTVTVECEDGEQAARLATDLANMKRPLRKVTIHCDTIGERDAVRQSLVELGYQAEIGGD